MLQYDHWIFIFGVMWYRGDRASKNIEVLERPSSEASGKAVQTVRRAKRPQMRVDKLRTFRIYRDAR